MVLVLFLKWVTALLNKILRIIFNPIVKCLTVAYKVHRFEMIRLYLNIEDSFHFSFLFFFFLFETNTQNMQNSNHISSSVGIEDGLRFNYG